MHRLHSALRDRGRRNRHTCTPNNHTIPAKPSPIPDLSNHPCDHGSLTSRYGNLANELVARASEPWAWCMQYRKFERDLSGTIPDEAGL